MSTIYERLNPEQQKAVYQTEGPLLILAGAGSGKTRTLTHRIAYLIDEKDVNPWSILAITFTNKAAGEMRERVNQLVEFGAESIWVSTFHSTCVRILRRHIEYLGFTTSFSIYDTDDQKTLLHQVLKKLDVDQKMYKDRVVMKYISAAKDNLVSPEQFCREAAGDYRQMRIGDIYTEYQEQLKKNNALDFDDLIVKTVELFRENPEVLEYYQNRFRYIMVDEYQDTNTAQFELIRLLAGRHRNLCVVGDDDQSIYKFRGANIHNILGFEQYFPDATVIRLEQNYRSTQNILNAANEVIKNNSGRKEKRLWTENEEGRKVRLKMYDTAMQEADRITEELLDAHADGFSYRDCAILYRTNAQSRAIEERMVNKGIPYQLVGGVNFYQRKEIKDILAYLKTIDNGNDDISVSRIINVPKRGIGGTTIGRVQVFADEQGMSFFEALRNAEYIPTLGKGRAVGKLLAFVEQIAVFRVMAENYSVHELIEEVLDKTGYRQELEEEDTIEAQTRLENIQEFINKAVDYEEHAEGEGSLSEFLEEVALVADIDRMDDEEDKVLLMTLHSAKGLEFDKVYLCGMEDGLFPSYMSIDSDDPGDLEEERRLAYVGITRAKKELTLTCARQRMVNGETRYSRVSRFCTEIPMNLLDTNMARRSAGMSGSGSGLSAGYTGGGIQTAERFVKTAGVGSTAASGAASGGESDYGNGISGRAGVRTFASHPRQNSLTEAARSGLGRQFKVEKMDTLPYDVGDRVKHIKFGEGKVLSIQDGKRDFEVTVDFDDVGTKRMFASFAKLKKI
ncbi:MAG: DNA helicase PcrA [Lachnospiraceae bacterium]|nr:DNA helicase PcrA [Lachnospiraceae bacterium]